MTGKPLRFAFVNFKSRNLLEQAEFIKDTFEAVVQHTLFPQSQIDIHVQVLQFDGALTATAINATTLALIDAGIPMNDYVSACSVGQFGNADPLLDTTHSEEKSEIPHLTLAVLPKSSLIALMQVDAKIYLESFGELVEAGKRGCRIVSELMENIVRIHVAENSHKING